MLITMDKSFRCTNEILNFGLKFINKNTEIKSFNRNGDEPQIYTADNQLMLNHMIISDVKTCIKNGYKLVALICKSEKNAILLFENLKDKLDVRLIKNKDASDLNGVFIIPVYMSKGLEFDAVLICDAEISNYNIEDGKRFLYVASTRALHKLSIFCVGNINPLLID